MSGRSNNFDGLRLVGALLVLFSHQFALTGRPEPRVVGDHSFGNLGVLIFFAVSGYLVTTSWLQDPHAGRFLLRRGLRLLPGLLVAIALGAPLLAWLRPEGFAWSAYLLDPWAAQHDAWFTGQPQTMLNGSLWTIPIELECYLVLCVAGLLARRQLRTVVALGSAVLLMVYLLVVGAQAGFDRAIAGGHVHFLAYFGAFFLAGAAFATWPALHRHAVWFGAAGIAALLAQQPTFALVLIVVPIVVTVGPASWPLLRDAGRFGDLSYGIYLYAWPVQQLGVHVFGTELPFLAGLAPSIAGATTMGWLSWHLVERRALALKPRRPRPAGTTLSAPG